MYGAKEAKRRKMLARAEARKEQAIRQKLRRVDQRQAVRSKFRMRAKAYAGTFASTLDDRAGRAATHISSNDANCSENGSAGAAARWGL